MLSLEYLLEEAKSNGLPLLKARGILREYLQVILLNSIYRHEKGRLIFFTGGTALRYYYGLPRFSEDLDFNTAELNFNDFEDVAEYAKKGLLKEGLSSKLSTEKRKGLFTAEFHFPKLMKLYGIVDKRGLGLMIKIKVYRPSWGVESESDVLSLYGYNFSSILLEKSRIFSEKLLALLNRKRGRDVYDTIFMLKRKFPINKEVLEANGINTRPKELILGRIKEFSEKELKFLTDQVKPFLFKEDDTELILNAPLYAEKFLT